MRNIADVTTAVARGDLTRKVTVDVRGEILELKNTINTMVDQLGSFASERETLPTAYRDGSFERWCPDGPIFKKLR